MTISSWTSRSLFAVSAVLAFALPTSAFAAVKIVDVMYDPPGADQGREWIQVENIGTTSVNLAGYRLYEGGTNHKLFVAAGTSTLAAGAKAVIATDPAQYAADHPAFAGTVFKSSLSLSNVGETIVLKDAKLAVVDAYTYSAPPVVKEPLPAKNVKAKNSSSASRTASAAQAAAVPLAQLPLVPALPSVWVYGLGLLTLLTLGAGAALYAWPRLGDETSLATEEFNIE